TNAAPRESPAGTHGMLTVPDREPVTRRETAAFAGEPPATSTRRAASIPAGTLTHALLSTGRSHSTPTAVPSAAHARAASSPAAAACGTGTGTFPPELRGAPPATE